VSAALVPMHPRACPNPADLRWVIPTGTLPVVGTVVGTPAPVAELLDGGVLAAIHLDPDAVITTLAPGRSWAECGARVRTALHRGLTEPQGWTTQNHADAANPLPCSRFCTAAARCPSAASARRTAGAPAPSPS
jgi:hypothetical protein